MCESWRKSLFFVSIFIAFERDHDIDVHDNEDPDVLPNESRVDEAFQQMRNELQQGFYQSQHVSAVFYFIV